MIPAFQAGVRKNMRVQLPSLSLYFPKDKKMELKGPSEFARMTLDGFKNTCSSDVKICEKDFTLKEED